MKLNKISLVLAAMAIVGCSSEDVSDFSANQAIDESGLIQLSPNFVLAGVGEEDATTRTHWEMSGGKVVNQFLPIYTSDPAADDQLDWHVYAPEQSVGLCWLGQVPGTDVYTNYQFYHFGWLNKGAKKAEFECNQLTNGAFYDEITFTAAAGAAGDEADPTNFTLPAKSLPGGLEYNSGIYRTENATIFGGDYIVYYPYNDEFKNAGTIPAAAVTTFDGVATELTDPQLGEQTFRYSNKVTIEGGNQAADFGLKNLSTLVRLNVFVPDGDGAFNKYIDQIVLYSAKEQLYKQVNLAADKIVAGQTGTALYATTEGTKTITANFAADQQLKLKANAVKAFITVLPTTVEDLVILVHNKTDKKWARISMPNTEFKPGAAKVIDVEVKADLFKSEYIAVDEPSLLAARNEARSAGKGTVTVIGDITLDGTSENPYDFNLHPKDNKITYTGDKIIVTEDVVLNTATNWKSDIRVLGKSCCAGTLGGRLNVLGGTLNNVTMEPTEAKVNDETDYNNFNPEVTYNGATTIAAGKNFDVQAGNVVVNDAVQHKGNITIAEGASLIVNGDDGDIQFMGSDVVNNGTIEVKDNANFDMTDIDGNAHAKDGKRMTNNGKFIHNVDAGVGTAVQSMIQNGEYRCRVNAQMKLDDAFLQWTACSVIEMVNAGAMSYDFKTAGSIKPNAYQHNKQYIDIEVNGGGLTTFNNPGGDSNTIHVRNLTVKAGGLSIQFNNDKRTLQVNENMVVEADATLTNSKQIIVKKDLTVKGATLLYKGNQANKKGLLVEGNITVSGGTFNANEVNALDIVCNGNFSLEDGASANFGNRKAGDAKNMTVKGEISNPDGCTFDIFAANQEPGTLLAWIDCTSLKVGGTFPHSRPRVVAE